MDNDTYDDIVIGAGMGGLFAAAYLARAGRRVLVLDRAVTPGGAAGDYTRDNMTFPTGATIAFGLEEGGVLRKLLRELGTDIVALPLTHPMDVVLPDRTVKVLQASAPWRDELARAFPERAQDVLACWHQLASIADVVEGITQARLALPLSSVKEVGNVLSYLVRTPSTLRLLPFALHTVADLLRRFRLDAYEPFVQFLDAQLLDSVQTTTAHAALLPAAYALHIYRKGSFYIPGGFRTLADALVTYICNHGGEVRLRQTVSAVTRGPHVRWQVMTTNNHTASAPTIIDATGTHLVTASKSARVTWGAVRMDALAQPSAVPASARAALERGLPFAYQVWTPPRSGDTAGEGPVYLTAHPPEPGHDCVRITVSAHTRPEQWDRSRPEDYVREKLRAQSFLLQHCASAWPTIASDLTHIDIGTPQTYYRYLRKSAIGGHPLTVKQAILSPRGSQTSLPGVYLAGDTSFPGPGTLSAALSGYFAAQAVLDDTR